MTQQEKDIKQYLREIEKLLFGPKKYKKQFLIEYEKTMYESMEEDGQIYTYERLVSRFGAPATIAENYAYSFQKEAAMSIKCSKLKKYIILLICCFVVIICLIVAWSSLCDSTAYYTGNYFTDGAWRCS